MPVIYVHARDHAPVGASEVKRLAALGATVCSRLAVAGAERTRHGYDEALALLGELGRKHPGQPVVMMRSGLRPSRSLLAQLGELERQAGEPCVVIPLSNAVPGVNPFAGLNPSAAESVQDPSALVALLAPGYLHPLSEWPDHFAYFPADIVKKLAAANAGDSLPQQLSSAGVQVVLADHLFVDDPDNVLFTKPGATPRGSQLPPPFGELTARLQAWLDAGITGLPVHAAGRPATLHITHSWGGGVAQWIESFIQADEGSDHFQLRSESADSKPPFGLKLSLYAGNELRCPIASWWLQPPIRSVLDTDPAVEKILTLVCRRFGIGRVFVSSLIGHSLDALCTGLPTVQILHDHFPVWPLLGVNPEPYLANGKGADTAKALADNATSQTFLDRNALSWERLRDACLQKMLDHGVKVAAPGRWVIDLQERLEPRFTALESAVIPHGYPRLEGGGTVMPKPRADGRLRMVILGRALEGKGSKLLLSALPRLSKYVQVYLLGAGTPGQAFFGIPGVDVVQEYDRKELGDLLETIGPDFAALLSVVPETFSYTLSELQQLGIPAIATRVGSFPHRIEHARTGWLIDADADSLVRQVAELCANPGLLEAVRNKLPGITQASPLDMAKAYNRLCSPTGALKPFVPAGIDSAAVQLAAVGHQLLRNQASLRIARLEQERLARDAAAMTAWARKEQRVREQWVGELQEALAKEQKNREEWVAALEGELKTQQKQSRKQIAALQKELEKEQRIREEWVAALERELKNEQERLNGLVTELHQALEETLGGLQHVQSELQQKNEELARSQAELQSTNNRLVQMESMYQDVASKLEAVLASKSWRITAPLRAARRVAANLVLARAWNPLRWPWLMASMVRNLHTLGLAGTLRRMQTSRGNDAPTAMPAPLPPAPETTAAAPAPMHFTRHMSPDASIVIPAYNQWAYTSACLASLQAARNRHSFEVIVVDDQSSDETPAELANIEGITALGNEKNLGFVGSCNAGAGKARGEFLVLLNNDTQVTDGWLDELIGTFVAEPEAGLVGSRLVYPDGSLQESGGIIYRDASGWNYGRCDVADRPEYQFLRESDYCSGACIALRTSLFRDLGGLDERYAPAYYEDTDLAFKVREAGLKVFVQPTSTVVHHEGVTSGTDTSSGTKRYQLVNQQKFLERWQEALATQPEPITDHTDPVPVRRATRHRQRGQVLFIDAFTPRPDRDSGSLRLSWLMRSARGLGYGVTFIADNLAHAGRYTRELQKAGIEVQYSPWIDSMEGFLEARGAEFDYVIISRHYVAANYVALLRRHCPDAKFIFDTVDLHYLREQRQAEVEGSSALKMAARQTRREELAVIKAADATLVVSPIEREMLAQEAPGSAVHILSNIHEAPGRTAGFSERKDIFFVGAYRHPPNVDAALWFVNDIWPLIRAKAPDMRFHLVGDEAPEQVRKLAGDGVVFHGYVESLQPFLDGCRLAVAPLRFGAGVKGKVNISMAHGQPVVATPVAAEGLFVEHGKECLLADGAEAFAGEVLRLYQDEALWYRLSDAATRNVERHFSPGAARDGLSKLFGSLSGNQKNAG